jgi:hypothetical protein
MSSNVPKFASFRPKPKPAPEPPLEPKKLGREPESPRSSRDSKHREKRRSKSAEQPVPERNASSSKVYFSDRRGDPDVVRYGALNKYDVPAYRRTGYGFVLGLGLDQKIDKEQSSDTRIYITPAKGKRQQRLLTDKHATRESQRTLRFIKAPNSQTAITADFISVSGPEHQRRDDDDDETSETDYRRIGEPRAATQPADPDAQYDSETEPTDIGAEVTKENSKLVRQTHENPQDIQAWLRFIDHQETVVKNERSSADLNDVARRQLADVRISIYEQALKRIGDDQTSKTQLWHGLLAEAQISWDVAKISSKYQEVLAKYSQSTELWFAYLDFVQSDLRLFKYESCRTMYSQCFEALRAGSNRAPVETILHLLIRLTAMIHQTGYQELALAIWQALLEFHIIRSANASEGGLDSFEAFWESEETRIGEILDTQAPQPINQSLPTVSLFGQAEAQATEALRMPGRTTDEAGEDDAFHTVFFADIEEYLKVLPLGTTSTLILEAFVCFCGLPTLATPTTQRKPWWSDPFLQHRVSASSNHSSDDDGELKKSLRRFADSPLRAFQMSSDILFQQEFSTSGVRLSPDCVRRFLTQIASQPSTEELVGEYLLAFETRHFSTEAAKRYVIPLSPTFTCWVLLEQFAVRRGYSNFLVIARTTSGISRA